MPGAGKLNRKVTIESPSTTRDEYGQPTQVWADVLTTWAAIRAVTSKEVHAASSFVSQVSHVVAIRWHPGILAKRRIIYRDRIFDIRLARQPQPPMPRDQRSIRMTDDTFMTALCIW